MLKKARLNKTCLPVRADGLRAKKSILKPARQQVI